MAKPSDVPGEVVNRTQDLVPVGRPKEERTLSIGEDIRVPYPVPSSAATSASMRGNRSQDTKPEILLRSVLHRRGWRFRKNYRVVLAERGCRVDIAFPSRRVAVFVDGCFWHGCPHHGRVPRTNTSYWEAKLARNIERDRQTDRVLRQAGWTVVRIWEHADTEAALKAVEETLEVDD